MKRTMHIWIVISILNRKLLELFSQWVADSNADLNVFPFLFPLQNWAHFPFPSFRFPSSRYSNWQCSEVKATTMSLCSWFLHLNETACLCNMFPMHPPSSFFSLMWVHSFFLLIFVTAVVLLAGCSLAWAWNNCAAVFGMDGSEFVMSLWNLYRFF